MSRVHLHKGDFHYLSDEEFLFYASGSYLYPEGLVSSARITLLSEDTVEIVLKDNLGKVGSMVVTLEEWEQQCSSLMLECHD
jgi:hypothetical protein